MVRTFAAPAKNPGGPGGALPGPAGFRTHFTAGSLAPGVPTEDGESSDPAPPEGRWPQEPGYVESDRFGEPEEPDPTDLGPPIPEAPDPTAGDVDIDPSTHRLFWALVVVFNAALLALSLGVMFAAFEGNYELGAQLSLAGIVLFVYGYVRYRRFESDDAETGPDEGAAADAETGPEEGTAAEGSDADRKR